ncbi:hypothetical protein ACFSTH_06505 [Paenibacillus yanchengensis]|uniref:Uncharacterized protein n=1 Tax=Paenibacillus yanchengensis TaxID=2035833 RepID=A0ABW4YIR0_9BACL
MCEKTYKRLGKWLVTKRLCEKTYERLGKWLVTKRLCEKTYKRSWEVASNEAFV